MAAIVFLRNLFIMRIFIILFSAQNINKTGFPIFVNEILLVSILLLCYYEKDFKKLFFYNLTVAVLYILYTLFIEEKINIKGIDWDNLIFYTIVTFLLLPDSIRSLKREERRKRA